MTGLGSWLKSSITILSARVCIQIVGAVAQLLIIPMLTAPEYGAFILLVSLGQLISPLAHGGLIVPMVTEASSRPNHRTVSLTVYLSLYLVLWLAVSSVIFAFTPVVTTVWSYTASDTFFGPHSHWLLATFVLLICLSNAAELIASQLLIAKEKIWQSTLAAGGVRYLALIVLLAYVSFSDTTSTNLSVIMLITVISATLSLAFTITLFCITVFQDQTQNNKPESDVDRSINDLPDRAGFKSIIVRAAESLGSFLFAQVRASAEVLMCTAIFGLSVAGVLAAARRISGALLMISQTLNVVIAPHSVRLLQDNDKHTLQRINQLIATFLILLCCIVLLATYVAMDQQWIAELESSYNNLALFIVIMTLGLAARFYFGSAMQILMANAHQRVVLTSYVYDFAASLAIYALTWLQKDPVIMIVLLCLSQACQYAWLAVQAQKAFSIRTRWL